MILILILMNFLANSWAHKHLVHIVVNDLNVLRLIRRHIQDTKLHTICKCSHTIWMRVNFYHVMTINASHN